MDIIMLILFVLFMVLIFGGYHKTKSAARELDFKNQEEKEKDLK
jgi:sensor domain CHASE-containing protein